MSAPNKNNPCQYRDEEHPYNKDYLVPESTKTVIIGTAPPSRFSNPTLGGRREMDADFYYGSEDNYMWWEILDCIAKDEGRCKGLFTDKDSNAKCIEIMKTFLTHHKMWMRDILQKYKRIDAHSAADDKITPIDFTDFSNTFKMAPFINKIAFTSEKAAKWTFQAFIEQGLIKREEFDAYPKWKMLQNDNPREKHEQPCFVTNLEGREILFYILPTPTGRSRTGLKIKDKISIYKSVLFPTE